MKVLVIDDRATDTIIAALRGWQNRLQGIVGDDDPLIEIAENGREGDSAMLSVDEIDDLIEERVNADATPYVIIQGNPIYGFQFIGPFADDNAMSSHADTHCRKNEWWASKLTNPIDHSGLTEEDYYRNQTA